MCDSMKLKKQIWVLILSLLGFSAALFFSPQLFGHSAFNIGLSRFEAVPTESGVLLEWDVETELGTAGYTIKRGAGDSYNYLSDPQGDGNLFILAEGGPTQAYSYSFVDESAVFNTTYTYQLIEITAGSSEQVQDEVTFTYQIEATTTPVTFSGDVGSDPENSAATATVTAPQATATTSAPTQAANAQSPTAAAPAPLADNPTADSAAQPDDAPRPLATVASQQEAYPGDSPVVSEEQSEAAGDSSPVVQDSEAAAVVTEETEVSGRPVNELTTSAYPGAANALEAPAVDQPALSTDTTSPVVIGGATGVRLGSPYPAQTEGQIEYQEPANADSTRILLWLAFLAAVAIFTASVVGAILLYSKQRSVN